MVTRLFPSTCDVMQNMLNKAKRFADAYCLVFTEIGLQITLLHLHFSKLGFIPTHT